MRPETEVLAEVLAFGRACDNIRVITQNGSRTDPLAPRDDLMDYDLVFHVRDLAPFLEDPGWCRVFGEIVIAQTPSLMEGSADRYPNFMSWYADGVRTDIRVRPLAELPAYLAEDTLTVLLLDKDGLVPALPPSSAAIHFLGPPSEQKLKDTVNEFYWVSLYVSKALARGQLLAASAYLDLCRGELLRLLAWNHAHDRGYRVNFGSQWKYLPEYLSAAEETMVLASYDATGERGIFTSLSLCRKLFARTLETYLRKSGLAAGEDVPAILALEALWYPPARD